jgi:hypothetical protein
VVLNACVTETKRGAVAVEHLDDLGEVGERAGQAVDLVDDDDVDAPGFDIGSSRLQRRALHRAAGEAAIVIEGRAGPASSPRRLAHVSRC